MDNESGRGALIHFVCTNPDHVGASELGYSTVHAALWAWCPSFEVVENHEWSATGTPITIGEARRRSRTGNLRGKSTTPSKKSSNKAKT